MSTGTPGLESLSPEQQAAIQNWVQQQVAAALAATQPPPPRELTPKEKAEAGLAALVAAAHGEKRFPTSDGDVHDAVIAVLSQLIDTVYAEPVATSSASETAEA